ncbi:hypothetical protein BC628DRAFT_1388328, partial [Trametes gibbosa]
MHNLRDLSFDAAFIPSGCDQPGLPAITFGTGVLTGTLNAFAHAHNVTMPGGADSSVALCGGYLLGGGHRHVLTASHHDPSSLTIPQRILQRVRTRSRQSAAIQSRHARRRTSHCERMLASGPVFFALRGGRSGFCAVLNVTMKVLPKLETSAKRHINVDAAFSEIVREIRRYNKVTSKQVARVCTRTLPGCITAVQMQASQTTRRRGATGVAWCCNDDSNTNALSTLVCSGMPGYGENIGSWPVLHIG